MRGDFQSVLISNEEIILVVGKPWWFIPKKPIIVSRETSRKELHVEFLPFVTYQRKPLKLVFLFYTFIFEMVPWRTVE